MGGITGAGTTGGVGGRLEGAIGNGAEALGVANADIGAGVWPIKD